MKVVMLLCDRSAGGSWKKGGWEHNGFNNFN